MLKINNITHEQIKHTLETSFSYEPGTSEQMTEALSMQDVQSQLLTSKEFVAYLQAVAMLARTYDSTLVVIGLVAFGMRLAENIANEKELEAAVLGIGGEVEDSGTI